MSHQHYDFLIIGGGMTAASAVKGIRDRNADGTIGIIGDDADPPMTRPALSKQLWLDPAFSLQHVWLHPEAHGAQLHLQHHATQLDLTLHEVRCSNGACFHYHRLLIATGGRPSWQQIDASDRVIYFRSVDDYRRLRAWTYTEASVHVAVVGGGWLGLELAAALSQQDDVQVQLVIPQRALGEQYFPPTLVDWLQRTFTAHDINLLPENHVLQGEETDDGVTLILEDGADLMTDVVVMCTGIKPCTSLAVQAGLEVMDGIVVNEHLQTSDTDVFAAGDVANYPDTLMGRQRVEHVDNAQKMGICAGRNMAGDRSPYAHTPYFYSQLFGLNVKGIGHMSADYRMDCHWQATPDGGALPCGIVLYRGDDDTIRGVLLINVNDADQGLTVARNAIGGRGNAALLSLLLAQQ